MSSRAHVPLPHRLVVAILALCPLCNTSLGQESDAPTRPELMADQGYTFEWAGIEERLDGDQRLTVLTLPRLYGNNIELRATVVIGWRKRSSTPLGRGDNTDLQALRIGARPNVSAIDTRTAPPILEELFNQPDLKLVDELYLEGPVEFFENGERIAYAGAIYLDRIDGHGWISDAHYTVREKLGGSSYVLKVHADWLRVSADGTLRSSDATITTSEFAIPSYTITSGDLQMIPTGDPEYPYDLSISKNAIQFGRWLRLPLPAIKTVVDERGEPTFGGVRVGDSARFGTTVGLEYIRDVKEGFGDKVNRWLGGDPDRFSSRLKLNLDWFGSRGVLFDPALRLRSADRYNWDMDLALIPDGGSDRGLVRVPTDDRDRLRLWYRSRGRFNRAPGEWFDLALTYQSDAAVQPEFFEEEYIDFEERQSFLQWRKSNGATYQSVIVSAELDDFRSQVQRLPEGRYAAEALPVFENNKFQVLYSSESSLGYYDREEGTPEFLEPAFADLEGETSSGRLDTDHRFEAPLDVGIAGLRATPFVNLRWTGWTNDVEEDDETSRLAALAGVRLATTFWRGDDLTGKQQITPSITWREDLAYEEGAGAPPLLDRVELEALEGQFVDASVRGRWDLPLMPLRLDSEIRAIYAADTPTTRDDWLPVSVFAGADTTVAGIGLLLSHDAIFDLDEGNTNYANTRLDIFPRPDLDISLGFTTGRASDTLRVFEAASFGIVYRFTPKWDILAQHVLDLEQQRGLESRVELTRYGHDLQFELEFRDREGEGVSIGIGIKPLLSARKRPSRRLERYGY